MKENGFYALIARMKYIDRWGLMKNTEGENVAEHSLMVAVLAHGLAVIGRDVLGEDLDPDRCAAAALFHDAPEILTGDLPTPVKYWSPALVEAYRSVEDDAMNRMLAMLPEGMRDAYRPLLKGGEGEVHRVVKAADRLSAYLKCVEELRSGNSEFKAAAEGILDGLRANPLPCLQYFLCHFLPAFELSLDELK